jgi:NAD+ synthetase
MSTPLRLAVAQFKPRKGSYPENLARVQALLGQADALAPRPAVVHFAETVLSGYFVEGGVREVAVTAGRLAHDLDAAYRAVARSGAPLDVVIGFYERWEDTLYNSALYARLGGTPGGEVRHVHRKVFLPTYGLFDEARFVEAGLDVRAFDTPWGRAALLVCEDAWHSLTGTIAALDGAQVVFISAAAPARGADPRDDGAPRPASVQRWERLVRDLAEEHGVYASLANLVGSEGGKAFQGSSLVYGPHGDPRGRAPVFDEALLVVDCDLADVARARADAPMLADLRAAIPALLPQVARAARGERPRATRFDGPSHDDLGGRRDGQHPADAADAHTVPEPGARPAGAVAVVHGARGEPAPLTLDAAMVTDWLVTFLRDEFARRGFSRAVVGLSGGVDSAVVTYLAARALGAANVTAVRMPYRTSHPDSLAHARLVVEATGVAEHTVDITAMVDGYLTQEPDADAARRGNVMARARMVTLFDQSAKGHALPLGTGNKSERLLGYFTWHADDSPPINPIGDLYKTQVWALARHLGVPAVIVDKPASADLIQGQTDEGDFGITYAKADQILHWLLSGWSAAELVARGVSADEVALVKRRLDGTHWKRKLPTVALLSGTAIGESWLRPVDY